MQYSKLCQENNLKLKECCMWFVAPKISEGISDFVTEFNSNDYIINGILTKVNVVSLGQFINNLYENIDDSKWYYLKDDLSISKKADYVARLIDLGLASLI